MITVAAHQPDLLPYSGFWYKMAKADVFDVLVHDQYVQRGYQRRVKMRGEWASIPVAATSGLVPITEVRIDPDEGPRQLRNVIGGRYGGSKHYDRVGPLLLSMIEDIHTDRLWQFNLELIMGVRELLGITTPIAISAPKTLKGAAGLAEAMSRYGTEVTYLSGTGGKNYMGECEDFTARSVKVEWSPHVAATGDSIVTVLMDYDDPMEIILNTTAIEERESA